MEPPWNPGRFTLTFWGGAWIINDSLTYGCSTAFGAHNRNYPNDYYMLTAGHCLSNFTEIWHAGAGNGAPGLPEGQAWSVSMNGDGASIRLGPQWGGTPNGGGGKHVYTRGVDRTGLGTGEGNQMVRSKSANLNLDHVIVSGSRSGEVGRNRIENNEALWTFNHMGATWYVRGSRVVQLDGIGAVGPGDSGGPVFVPASGGVSARGIVSVGFGAATTGNCVGVQTSCYSEWGFGDIHIALDDMNLYLNVG